MLASRVLVGDVNSNPNVELRFAMVTWLLGYLVSESELALTKRQVGGRQMPSFASDSRLTENDPRRL